MRSAFRLALVLLPLALALAGCDLVYNDDDQAAGPRASTAAGTPRNRRPAATPLPPPSPSPSAAPAEAPPGPVTVRAGQTLYAVSREQNVPVRTLIDANNLQPPYTLRVGQILLVPHVRQYVVKPGDTLYGVSRRTEVSAAALARVNNLDPPYILKTGTSLVLPPTNTVASSPEPPPPPRPATASGPVIVAQALPPPPAPPAPPPVTPPSSVATKPVPPVKPAPPPAEKPAATPATVVPTPPPAPPPAPVAEAKPVPEPKPAPVAETKPPPPPPAEDEPAADKPPSPPEPESGMPAAAGGAPVVAAIVANHRPPSAPLFYWPVRGKLLSAYGPAATGTHNDGLNIAAPEGTDVAATESGVVAYAGDELRGYGNLILIKHADGWVSAYGHNKEMLVHKGDHVRRGEVIAKVGTTGGVGQPQLHFELRQGTKAIDPLDHLPPPGGDSG